MFTLANNILQHFKKNALASIKCCLKTQNKLSEDTLKDYSLEFLNQPEKINRGCGIYYHGRSGSSIVWGLLDGHPEILNFPMSDFSGEWIEIKKFIKKYSDLEISERISALLENIPLLIKNIDNNKNFQHLLQKSLLSLAKRKLFIPINILKAMHVACYLSTGKKIICSDPMLMISIHSLIHESSHDLEEGFQKFYHIVAVRDPIKAFDSEIQHLYNIGRSHPEHLQVHFERFIDLPYATSKFTKPTLGISFEDLHKKPRKTIKKLISILKLPWSLSLLKLTNCGGPLFIPNAENKMIGKLNKKFSTRKKLYFLSEKDIEILSFYWDFYLKQWNYKRNISSGNFNKKKYEFDFIKNFLKKTGYLSDSRYEQIDWNKINDCFYEILEESLKKVKMQQDTFKII